jgi:carotene epsilon-monooxygenase
MRRGYLEVMLSRVFGPSSEYLGDNLAAAARSGQAVNMEAAFSQLTLDIIGKAVFNYDFNSLNVNSPLIQVGGGLDHQWLGSGGEWGLHGACPEI